MKTFQLWFVQNITILGALNETSFLQKYPKILTVGILQWPEKDTEVAEFHELDGPSQMVVQLAPSRGKKRCVRFNGFCCGKRWWNSVEVSLALWAFALRCLLSFSVPNLFGSSYIRRSKTGSPSSCEVIKCDAEFHAHALQQRKVSLR